MRAGTVVETAEVVEMAVTDGMAEIMKKLVNRDRRTKNGLQLIGLAGQETIEATDVIVVECEMMEVEVVERDAAKMLAVWIEVLRKDLEDSFVVWVDISDGDSTTCIKVGIPCIARRSEIDVIVTAAFQEFEDTAALFSLCPFLSFLSCFSRDSCIVDVTSTSSVGENTSSVGVE